MEKRQWIATAAAGGTWLMIEGLPACGQTLAAAAPMTPEGRGLAAPSNPPGSIPSVNQPPISWGSTVSSSAAPAPIPGSQSSRGAAAQTALAPTSAASAAETGSINVSAAAAARLRSAGLDPAAPQFRAQLAARLASVHAAIMARAAAKPDGLRLTPGLLEAIRRLPVSSPNVLAANHSLAWGGAANTTGDGTARQLLRPNSMTVAQANDATLLQIDRLYEAAHNQGGASYIVPFASTGSSDLLSDTPFSVPNLYVATFNMPGESPLEATVTGEAPPDAIVTAAAHYSVPTCRVEVDWPAYFAAPQRFPGLERALMTPHGGAGNAKVNGAVAFGFMPVAIVTGDSPLPVLPLGKSIQDGTITLRWNNFRTDIRARITGGTVNEDETMVIGSEPPFFASPNAMGFGAKQLMFSNPSQARLNTTANEITGTDTIGIGAQLGTGYTVQNVTVVQVSSVLDQPGISDAPVDNNYRGAQVAFPPTDGRMEVNVNWHIGPGDSLEYVLQWTFSGPAGQRPVLTMPLRGPCDS
jgi:hypothetical protein